MMLLLSGLNFFLPLHELYEIFLNTFNFVGGFQFDLSLNLQYNAKHEKKSIKHQAYKTQTLNLAYTCIYHPPFYL